MSLDRIKLIQNLNEVIANNIVTEGNIPKSMRELIDRKYNKLVSNTGKVLDWDIHEAELFCVLLLDDVSAHRVSAAVDKLLAKMGEGNIKSLRPFDSGKLDSMVRNVAQQLDHDILAVGAFCVLLLEDVNAREESSKVDKLLIKLFKAEGLFEDVEYLGEAKGTKSAVQHANDREKLIIDGINKLAKKYGLKLEPIHYIDANGEISFATKKGRHGESALWPQPLVDLLAKHKFTYRTGTVSIKVPKGGSVSWGRANHFEWERVLKAIGINKKEFIKNDEAFWGKGNTVKESLDESTGNLWMRVGDRGDYDNYGIDFAAAADYLAMLEIDEVSRWVKGGFEADEFKGRNYVSLYWGDKDGNLVKDLSTSERKKFEKALGEDINEAAGSGTGKYKPGKVVIKMKDIKKGDLLIKKSKEFKSTNLVRVTEVGRAGFKAVYADPKNPLKKSGAGFTVWDYELGNGEYYEVKGGASVAADEMTPDEVISKVEKELKRIRGVDYAGEIDRWWEGSGSPSTLWLHFEVGITGKEGDYETSAGRTSKGWTLDEKPVKVKNAILKALKKLGAARIKITDQPESQGEFIPSKERDMGKARRFYDRNAFHIEFVFNDVLRESLDEAVDTPDQVKMIVVKSFKKVSSPKYGDYFVYIPKMSAKLKQDKAVAALLKKRFKDSTAAKDAAQKVFKNAQAAVEDTEMNPGLAAKLNQIIEGVIVIGTKSQIGQTILDQMGGYGRLSAMLGINRLKYTPKGVGFGWPSKKRSKGNYVEITLRPDDTYDMEFFNLSVKGKKSVKKMKGIYADQVVELFEKQTGYYLRLSQEYDGDSLDEGKYFDSKRAVEILRAGFNQYGDMEIKPTEAERKAIIKLWDKLPGNTSLFDAIVVAAIPEIDKGNTKGLSQYVVRKALKFNKFAKLNETVELDEARSPLKPELAEFGEAVKKLSKVSGYKPQANGIDVMVEGEPVHVTFRKGQFWRDDFSISVPLGKDVGTAVKAFDKMLKTPFNKLRQKYGTQKEEVSMDNPTLSEQIGNLLDEDTTQTQEPREGLAGKIDGILDALDESGDTTRDYSFVDQSGKPNAAAAKKFLDHIKSLGYEVSTKTNSTPRGIKGVHAHFSGKGGVRVYHSKISFPDWGDLFDKANKLGCWRIQNVGSGKKPVFWKKENLDDITEGTWSIPDTVAKMKKLRDLLKKKFPVGKEGADGSAGDILTSIWGNDSLFDALGNLYDAKGPNADARPVIRKYLPVLKRYLEKKKVKPDVIAILDAFTEDKTESLSEATFKPNHDDGDDLADFLDRTLIPDLKRSGMKETAKDFQKCAKLLRAGRRDKPFEKWLKTTLIPDLKDSGTEATAHDFEEFIYWSEKESEDTDLDEGMAKHTSIHFGDLTSLYDGLTVIEKAGKKIQIGFTGSSGGGIIDGWMEKRTKNIFFGDDGVAKECANLLKKRKVPFTLRNKAGKVVMNTIPMHPPVKGTEDESLNEATFYSPNDYVLIFKSFKQLEKFIGIVEDAHEAGELSGGGGGPSATTSFPVSYSLIGGWGRAKAVSMVLGKDAKLRKEILDIAKKVFRGVEVRKITKKVKLPDFHQLPPEDSYKVESLNEYKGDLKTFMWTLAADAAKEAFKLMSRKPLTTQMYVWYLPQGEELKVAENKPGSKWKLAINERIPISKTTAQIKQWIYDQIRRIPILKAEDMSYLDEIFGGRAALVLMQYPSKKWGFAGNVPSELAWERKDGKKLTDDDIADLAQSPNPALSAKSLGIKGRSFKTPEEARKAAKKAKVKITQDTSKGESFDFDGVFGGLEELKVDDELDEAKPSEADWKKAEKIAVDPATKATFWDIKGTVWYTGGPGSGAVVNKGSLKDFLAQMKAGKYAARIKLVKEDMDEAKGTEEGNLVFHVKAEAPKCSPSQALGLHEIKVFQKNGKYDIFSYHRGKLEKAVYSTDLDKRNMESRLNTKLMVGPWDLEGVKDCEGEKAKIKMVVNKLKYRHPSLKEDLAAALNQIVEDVSVGLGEAKETVLDKLPPNTELFGHDNMSTWDGKLAVVYEPFMADYSANDFNAANMTRKYHLYYVDDGKGKPLDVKAWKDIVGNTINSWGKGNFTISTRDRTQPMKGKFIEPGTIFHIKVKVKDLQLGEVRKLRGYLTTTRNFLDATDLKRPLKIKDAKIFLSGKIKDIDTLYSVYGDAGLDTANTLYELASWQAKDEAAEEKALKKMLAKNGIFVMNKKGDKFKYILPKKGKFESLEFDADQVELDEDTSPEPGSFAATLNSIVGDIGLTEADSKLTPDQTDEIKKEMIKNGVPVRFLRSGTAFDITTGKPVKKGSNIMYHPVYWNFTKNTAKKIAGWLAAKAVFSEDVDALKHELHEASRWLSINPSDFPNLDDDELAALDEVITNAVSNQNPAKVDAKRAVQIEIQAAVKRRIADLKGAFKAIEKVAIKELQATWKRE